MASMVIEGIRYDHIRACKCGRRPDVRAGYDTVDLPSEAGPFVILCYCGRDPETLDARTRLPILPRMVRSWSKTRAVALWSRFNRDLL